MDDRLHTVLARTDRRDLDMVASGFLSVKATVIGDPVLTHVPGHIVDPRTLGVVKVSGMAEIGNGGPAPWSAVAKVVDPAGSMVVETQWTRPGTEEIVYEEGFFAGGGQTFRPARCYLVSRPEGTIRVFWLEDLTGAEHAPFSEAAVHAPRSNSTLENSALPTKWTQMGFAPTMA